MKTISKLATILLCSLLLINPVSANAAKEKSDAKNKEPQKRLYQKTDKISGDIYLEAHMFVEYVEAYNKHEFKNRVSKYALKHAYRAHKKCQRLSLKLLALSLKIKNEEDAKEISLCAKGWYKHSLLQAKNLWPED